MDTKELLANARSLLPFPARIETAANGQRFLLFETWDVDAAPFGAWAQIQKLARSSGVIADAVNGTLWLSANPVTRQTQQTLFDPPV